MSPARHAVLALCLAAPVRAQGGAAEPGALERDGSWAIARRALFARAAADAGLAEPPFPPLWPSSTYLLEDARFGPAAAALEALARPPADEPGAAFRVLLAGDLWALCDWAAPRAGEPAERAARREALRLGAARALCAVAPRAQELDGLPDTLRAACEAGAWPPEPDPSAPLAPFLPADLGREVAGWVALGERVPREPGPLALEHALAFGGRAAFTVFLRVPGEGGDPSAPARAYLDALAAHGGASPCAGCAFSGEGPHLHLDPGAPAPPAGSVLALVARAIAIDAQGELRATPLATMVQMRAFLAAPPPGEDPGAPPLQAVAELRLDRARLLAGDVSGALVAVGADEVAADLLGAHGDPFEHPEDLGPRLRGCIGCHGAVGAASAVVYTGLRSGPFTHEAFPLRRMPRALAAVEAREVERQALEHARGLASYQRLAGLLEGLRAR